MADYAMEVFGFPNHVSEAEILSHFESLYLGCLEEKWVSYQLSVGSYNLPQLPIYEVI